ncbi:MAG: patatin-like phospholipase family protein [Gemmatimonadaceae bacterium]
MSELEPDRSAGAASAPNHPPPRLGPLALVLGGGGARGAYQAGVVSAIASRCPALELPILTGISAGAISTAFLASSGKSVREAAEDLVKLWLSVASENVYRVDTSSLLLNVTRWGWRLVAGGLSDRTEHRQALVDTAPLAQFLRSQLPTDANGGIAGIDQNLASGRLKAVALTATSYTTGQSVTWVQGRNLSLWERPQRRAEIVPLTIDHIMASSSLPLLFPAVRVDREWYGDGGIRLTAPLSPALHLGASRILTISTRYARTRVESDVPLIVGYPPPAQVVGTLYNAVFLDLIDQDIHRLQMVNNLLDKIPDAARNGMRRVDILVIRPSQDLGKMARRFEPSLPSALRFLTRGWGTRRTASPDMLSLMMFQPDYLRALVELGEADVAADWKRIEAFLQGVRVAADVPAATIAGEQAPRL